TAVIRADFQADARAEGEACEQEWKLWVSLCEIVEAGAGVLLFAARVVVRACALARAAKVEAERDEARVVQRACGAKDDLVVHCAAVQRVRVQDERGGARLVRLARLFQDRFELPVRCRDEEIAGRIQSCPSM